MNRLGIGVILMLAVITASAQDQLSGDALTAQSELNQAPAEQQELSTTLVSPVIRKPVSLESTNRVLRSTFRIPGERQKKFGSTMTGIGAALIVGGIVMYANSDKTPEYVTYMNSNGTYTSYYEYDPKYIFGIMCMVVGTGVTIPGILIWRKGIKTNNKYLLEQQNLSFYLQGNGGTLAYRF
jgi:hypothetical protein